MNPFKYARTIVALFLFFVSILSVEAKMYSGKILSSQGNEPVPFANIIIKGTTIGIASGVGGEFVLDVPKEYRNGVLLLSSVGFSTKEMPVSDLKPGEDNIIILNSQNYNIDEVDVETESRVLYGAVKRCSQNIENNYVSVPYTYDIVYEEGEKIATGSMSDSKGYKRTSSADAYKSITYNFDKNDTLALRMPYFEGKTNMEDLLSYDLVRNVGNLIDEQNVYDYDLSLKSSDDDNIWVIHFKAKNPQLYNTGDAHISVYEGELFIQKQSYVISKIVLRGKSDKRSMHGKSVAVTDKTLIYTLNHNFEVEVKYVKDAFGFRLDRIEMLEIYTTINNEQKTDMSSLQIKSMKDEFVKIKGRDYYVRNM